MEKNYTNYAISRTESEQDNRENSKKSVLNEVKTGANATLSKLVKHGLLNEDSKALITGADILNQSFVQEDGCSGSVYPSIFGIILLGACVIIIRRKRGVNNEEN